MESDEREHDFRLTSNVSVKQPMWVIVTVNNSVVNTVHEKSNKKLYQGQTSINRHCTFTVGYMRLFAMGGLSTFRS